MPLQPPDLPTSVALIALLPLGWAAAHDVVARTIPNEASLALALLGAAARAGEGWGALLPALLAAALVLAACVLLWARGLLGGGDAKLLPACALLVPAAAVPGLLADVAIAGGLLSGAYLLLGRLAPAAPPLAPGGTTLRRVRAVEWRRIRRRGPLPYGVAIAAGAALALAGQGA